VSGASSLHFCVKKVYSGVEDGIFEISCDSFHNWPSTWIVRKSLIEDRLLDALFEDNRS